MFTIAIVLSVIVLLVTWANSRISKRVPQHLPGWSMLQSMLNLRKFRKAIVDSTKSGAKWWRMYIIGQETMIATHPDTIKLVLTNPEIFPKQNMPAFSKRMAHMFGRNLLTLNGDEWQHHRRALSPAFHYDAVKSFIPLFVKKTNELLEIWNKIDDKPVFAQPTWMPKYTLDVLSTSVFGYDFRAIYGNEDAELDAYYTSVNYGVKPLQIARILASLITHIPLTWDLDRAVGVMDNFCRKLILEHERNLDSKDKDPNKFDIVDMMLRAEPKLTIEEMVSDVFLFFVAGHETTSSALSWLMYYLAQHPEIQEKARKEARAVLQGQEFTAAHLREFTYISMVLKENMRIQPPIAALSTRKCVQDTEFEGIKIPAGTRIGLGFEAVHHNPLFWPEPEKFIPERFELKKGESILEESSTKQHPFAYFPFSLRSRACIGNQFSVIEQTVFVSMLLQKYSWTTATYKPPTVNPILNHPDELSLNLTRL
jgi:cytochrome P450